MLTSLALKMLQISIETSIVILAVWLLIPLLNKRYSSKLTYYIWLAIIIRLLLPFSLALPNLTSYINPISDIVVNNNSQELSNVNIEPEVIEHSNINTSSNTSNIMINPISSKEAEIRKIIDLKKYCCYLPAIWLLGIGLYISYQFLNYKKYYKLIDKWSCVCNVVTQNIVSSVMLDLNISRKLTVLQSKIITSPMIMGFFKPKLVLPICNYSENDLNNIVKHELTHLKRYDIWYKLLLQIVIAVHWYNPMILLMKNQALKSIELSCDEVVIKGLDINSRKQYSYTILNSIIKQQQNLSALTTYFNNSNITVKERIKNVMDQTKKRKGIIAFTLVFICVALTGSILAINNNNVSNSGSQSFESADVDKVFTTYIASLNDDGLAIDYGSIPHGDGYRIYTVKSIKRREDLKVYVKQFENSGGELVWTVYKHEYVKPENETWFVAEAWGHAVKYHDSKARFNLLSEELKKQYVDSNDKPQMLSDNFSSVVEFSYECRHDHISITYKLTDLIPTYYNYQEKLDFDEEDGKIVVTAINGKKQIKKPIESQMKSRAVATDYKPDSAKYISALENTSVMKLMDLEEFNKIKNAIKNNPLDKFLICSNDPETLFKKYSEALLSSDYMAMHLISSNMNFIHEGLAIWESVKVTKVRVEDKTVKDNKACYKINIYVEDGGESELKNRCGYTRYLYMVNINGLELDSNMKVYGGWCIVGLSTSYYNDLGYPSEEWWSN